MQNLQLLLHVPDLANLDAQTTASWQLFDRQSVLLREGTSTLAGSGAGKLAEGMPRAERVAIVLPARRIVYIETPLPPVSAQKRDALLRYAIEDKLTIDPATVHAVVLGASASRQSNMHVVAAIDRAWLAAVLRWLQHAGIEPAQAVPAASLIAVADDEWAVALDGAHGVARRPDGFAYSFDIATASGPGAQAIGIPRDPPFALALALKEAREHQVAPSRLTVLVDRPGSESQAWVETWQRVLACPVRVAPLPATRMVSPGAGNLLTGDFAPRSSARGWMTLLKPALALAVLIAIVQLVFTVVDAWRLDHRRQSLEREMTQVFKEAFPKAQAIVDPALQMRRNLDALKREAGLGAADDARALLAGLTAILKSAPNLLPSSVIVRESEASVDVLVTDGNQQAALKSRAGETPGATFAVDAKNIVRLTVKAQR